MSPILNYYNLAPSVTAFSTTRQGGVSQGNYASLNINAYCGDEPEAIMENRRLLCRHLGLEDISRLIMPHQVHGTEVLQVTPGFLSLPESERLMRLEGVDALMTDVRGVCIGVSTADCIPVIIYDPEHHCAATVHAGWRGTVAGIVRKTLARMAEVCHCRPAKMLAVIGPGISLKNFEVGEEVYEQFIGQAAHDERVACRLPASGLRTDGEQLTWHIDLPLCNRLQLQSMGVPDGNILDCGICTYSHHDRFFSARRLGVCSGRIFTGIILHEKE